MEFLPSSESDLESEPLEASTAAPMASGPRVAIVTAYYNEPRTMLERCLRSIRAQSVAADHILVADGLPQDWLDHAGIRHISLDRNHRDYGNTPRGVGAILAIAEDYDAIAFLDADNWLEENHVAAALAAASARPDGCDYVVAQRHFRRPDETILDVADEPIRDHVDTNCFLFLPGAFHVLQNFALIPQQLSGIGDRIFYSNLLKQGLKSAVVPTKTVNYHCMWEETYRTAGEVPPAGAKPSIDNKPILEWLNGLSPRARLGVMRRTGLPLA